MYSGGSGGSSGTRRKPPSSSGSFAHAVLSGVTHAAHAVSSAVPVVSHTVVSSSPVFQAESAAAHTASGAAAAAAAAKSAAIAAKAAKVAAKKQRERRQRKQRLEQARKNLRKDSAPPKAKKAIHSLPSDEQRPAKLAIRFGKKFGIPPSLLMGQMKQESGFNPNAVSSAGAYGLSQFIPSTAQSYGVKPGSSRAAQRSQVRGQAAYMSDLLKQTGDINSALSSYSGGYSQSAYNAPVEANAAAYKKLDKVAGVKGVKVAGAPKQLPGGWAGSKKAVLSHIPKIERAEGRGDKRTPAENSAVGGATDSDHLTTNKSAYAADIPVNSKVYHAIQRKLGLPQTATGEQSVVKGGYRYQLIYGAQYDHADHIHLGAEWVGSGTPPTSYSGVTASGGASGAVSGTPASTPASGGASVASRKVAAARERQRHHAGRRRVRRSRAQIVSKSRRSLRSTEPLTPLKGFTPHGKTTDVRTQPVRLGLS